MTISCEKYKKKVNFQMTVAITTKLQEDYVTTHEVISNKKNVNFKTLLILIPKNFPNFSIGSFSKSENTDPISVLWSCKLSFLMRF